MCSQTFRAVIFDLDGTLIDSKEIMRRAYFTAHEEVLGGEHPAPPFSEYCKYLGCSFPEIMRRMGLPAERMHSVFVRESTRMLGEIQLFDGVLKMLHDLEAAAIPLAVATGKDQARTMKILEHLGIAGHFSMVVGSDLVARPKPAPDMAQLIASRLNLDPSTTLFLGDAIADIQCGRAAGMVSALATWDAPSDEVLRHPVDLVLSHPSQILPLVGLNSDADLVAG